MAVVFLTLDSVWLGLVAKKFYKKNLGHLMAKKPNFIAAAIFYAIFVIGLLTLVVSPASKEYDAIKAVWSGALFGLVCYATYDLTSHAFIKDWPLRVTLIDLIWGTFVSGVVAISGYWIASGLL